MTMKCPWCGCDPDAPIMSTLSPHSTWCVHYRPPPSAVEVLEAFNKLMQELRDMTPLKAVQDDER